MPTPHKARAGRCAAVVALLMTAASSAGTAHTTHATPPSPLLPHAETRGAALWQAEPETQEPEMGALVSVVYQAQGWALGSLGASERLLEQAGIAEAEAAVREAGARNASALQREMQHVAGVAARKGQNQRALVDMAGAFQAADLSQRATEAAELLRSTAALERQQVQQIRFAAGKMLQATTDCIRFVDGNPIGSERMEVCPDLAAAQKCHWELQEAVAVANQVHPHSSPPAPPEWAKLCSSWGCEARQCWCAQVDNRLPGFCRFFSIAAWGLLAGGLVAGLAYAQHAGSQKRSMEREVAQRINSTTLLLSDEADALFPKDPRCAPTSASKGSNGGGGSGTVYGSL